MRRVMATAVVLLLTSCGSPPLNSPPDATLGPAPTPFPSSNGPLAQSSTFAVDRYGAVGDGVTDNSTAFARAIDAAERAGGGTVYVPAGRYIFSLPAVTDQASILLAGPVAITFQGAGRDLTSLIGTLPDKNLLAVFTDHTAVSDLTLDTQTRGGAAAIFVRANYTTLLRTRVLGGAHAFALYYAGPAGAQPLAPAYNVGNTVNDLVLNDLVCDDGFSWSFQKDSSISNVVHTGSRLALYVDEATTVTGYHYTPGSQQCDARVGFWLTPPAADIAIIDFVSSGDGGKVGVNGPGGVGRVADNVTIRGMVLTGTGNQLSIGDVRNLVLQGCRLGNNNIVVVARQVAQGNLIACTFARLERRSAPGALVSITVHN